MRFSFRPAKVEDFPACCRMLVGFGRGHYDGEVLQTLPRLWTGLLAQGALSMSVFEDEDLRPDRRLVGFGTGVFVSDAFCGEMLAHPKPYLANRVYRSCLDGHPLPLGSKAIGRANSSGGVNLVPLDFALAERDFFRPDVFPLLGTVWEAFHFSFYGFRLRCILQEVHGEDWRDFLLAAGLRVYAQFDGLPAPRPFLLGISREEFRARAGSRYTFFFTAPLPRFQFSPSEQRLLLLALRNVGAGEAAEELGISPNTVKELWKRIFRRVEDAHPDWFPCRQGDLDHRGPERRRHLLDYLAHHLEELRPWLRPVRRPRCR